MGIGASSCTWIQPVFDQTLAQTDEPVDLTIVAFNVESGDANPVHVAEQHVAPLDGVDIWGFSEVQNAEWLRLLEKGAETGERANFHSILGASGGDDRLAIVYNSAQLRAIRTEELDALSFGGRVRAALITHFQVRRNGQEFLLMVNHLYRSENERRHEQAQMLNTWAQTQTLPIIAIGDYNFDFDVVQGDQGTRDRGFDLMLQNGIFQWIRPQTLVPTHCDSTYNTILDFIFVGNSAINWPVKESAILFADPNSGYCPDTDIKSDHRPVMATVEIPAPL